VLLVYTLFTLRGDVASARVALKDAGTVSPASQGCARIARGLSRLLGSLQSSDERKEHASEKLGAAPEASEKVLAAPGIWIGLVRMLL
jgi:hypothetical protein